MKGINNNKHYAEISAAKGLLIILMVIGHSGAPHTIGDPLSLLRMPCFFLISGYLFKEKYLNDAKQFIYKKVKGLYYPFVKWSLIFLLLHNIFYHINIYSTQYNVDNYISKVLQIVTMTGSEQLLGGFWFLKELLYASIISFLLFKLLTALNFRLKLSTLVICSLCFMFLAFCQSIITFKIPTIGSETLLATSYFIAGVAFHKFDMLFTDLNKLKIGITLFAVFIISSLFVKGSINSQGYIIFPYYVISIIASISVIYLTKYLGKRTMNALDFVGKKTLYVLIFHFISFKLVSFVYIIITNRPITQLSSFPVIENDTLFLWIIYSIVGVTVPLVIKYGMDKISSLCESCDFIKKLQQCKTK